MKGIHEALKKKGKEKHHERYKENPAYPKHKAYKESKTGIDRKNSGEDGFGDDGADESPTMENAKRKIKKDGMHGVTELHGQGLE